MVRFWFKTCQIRHFPRPKRTLLENGNVQSVAIFSRTNGNFGDFLSNETVFTISLQFVREEMEIRSEMLAAETKMDSISSRIYCTILRRKDDPGMT